MFHSFITFDAASVKFTTMLRLFSSQCLHELHLVASCVTKRSFVPVSGSCHHRSLLARHLNTGISLWKDAPQPKADKSEELQTVDLDKWKSVMRAQAASEEKQQVDSEDEASDGDGDDDDENLREAAGDSKDSSSLEATRDLVAMWRHAGKLVPQEMTDEEVRALAELTTKSSRKKYLKYLAKKECHRRTHKEKQAKKKAEREAWIEQSRGQDEKLRNTFFLQFWSRSLDKVLAWRSAQAMVFGQPLVYDLSYESNMLRRDVENTVSQLMDVEAYNRRATDPFHLHFCNLQPDGTYRQELLRRYGKEAWDRLLITSTDRQHVDVFPREQLVYLTADSPNVLRKFDHSKVYIIGALVDRSIQSGLSLANAKRLKLATARLPLNEFLHWEMGAKNLTLDQMFRIMLTLKETGNWEEALQFVPKRKHDGFLQKEMTSNRVRGPRKEGDRGLRSGERTFKNEGHSLHRPHKQPGFSGRDRMARLPGDRDNEPAAKTVRVSLKNSLEGRKGAGKSKMWWADK
ncbi:tRNA methyltransferase 10 homolog C [Larimichthys crocea]|uniref:tRNA methyltransferase 10 homolog C n=1 Tax=Larimichthys crocea TaxID=215358 RepID=UPI00054C0BD8|nr:tRNA methyltransferase 10 homolog C [Larimichthys crocea]